MVWSELEKEFSNTCNILLGAKLPGGLEDYFGWLAKRVPLPYSVPSAVSKKEVWISPPLNFCGKKLSKLKAISMEEMAQVSETPLRYEDISSSGIKDFTERVIKPVAYIAGNFRHKTCSNIEKCSGAGAGMNLYHGEDLYLDVKNIAYSNYAMFSQNMFGCHNVPYSKFCIHAYNSVNLSRCFEVDGCSRCTDLLFCHNCEGVSDSLFCFNAKNLRYAIGNIEVGISEYQRVKKIVLGRVTKQLLEDKTVDIDIYDLGSFAK